MWLEKLLLKRRVRRLTGNAPVNLFRAEHARCVKLLELLDPSLYEKYTPADGINTEVELLMKNLDDYLKVTQDLVWRLKGHKVVTYELVKSHSERRATNIDSFLVSSDNCYIPINTGVDAFKKLALAFCAELVRKEKQTEAHYEQNVRMTTGILVDTEILARAFLEIAYR